MSNSKKFLIPGEAGNIECLFEQPLQTPCGLAALAHPHPLYGGTMDNKVIAIMARTLISLGYCVIRMNFRGVGRSDGIHNNGIGETNDMATVLNYARERYSNLPIVLGGFSFGTYVQSRLQEQLAAENIEVKQLILVSTTAGIWSTEHVPSNTVLIHGEYDTTVPLTNVLDWAREQDLVVHVVSGADHLFNRKLHHITKIISQCID